MSKSLRRAFAAAAMLPAAASPCRAGAGIVTDGSLGLAATVAGANAGRGTFTIPQNLGRLAGSNLFHSFSVFNVDAGQTAKFTTTTAVANVVSRVTGGAASQIDGTLQLAPAAGSAPNFFFINPAGVTFGSGAAIDVPAAFHVGTADYIKFPDGNFYADRARASTFSSAAPEAFGFLGATQAAITIGSGAEIRTAPGQPIGIAGGSVTIDGANVYSAGGEIRLTAVGKAARQVGLTGALPDAYGSLDVKNGATVDATHASDGKGGDVAVSGGTVRIVDGGTLWSDTYYSTAPGGNIDVKASGDLLVANGGQISSSSMASGDSGSVKVHAGGNLTVDDADAGRYTGIFSYAWLGKGNAGSVDATAGGNVAVVNGGTVYALATGAGTVGDVKVSGRAVRVAGADSTIKAEAGSGATSGRIGNVAVTATETLTVADAGQIYIANRAMATDATAVAQSRLALDAADVVVQGGSIGTSTSGNVAAAGVAVTAARDVTIGNGGFVTSLTSGSGSAGPLEVKAGGDLRMIGGARITGGTYGAGQGGKVTVDAANITADGAGLTSNTGIGSVATRTASGSGGDVEVRASGQVTLANRGEITSITYGAGRGGAVDVRAGEIVIDGGGYSYATGINAQAAEGKGNAGDLHVTVRGGLSVANGGGISSKTFSDGRGGALALSADHVVIDGRGSDLFTGITSGAEHNGEGGSLNISVGKDVVVMHGGKISASTTAAGKAGDLTIQAGGGITIDGKGISSGILNQSNGSGEAGNIAVSAASNVSILDGGKISGSAFATGKGGSIRVTAGDIVIDGRGSGALTAIVSDTNGDGAAGAIDISAAGRLALTGGGGVASRAYAAGSAGEVSIRAKDVEVGANTEISTAAMAGKGHAGIIKLAASGNLSVLENGQVSSSTRSAGDAGSVTVDAENVVIDAQGRTGGIYSNANSNSSGKAGSVEVTAHAALSMRNGAQISSSTWATGDAGAVKVSAGSISIDGKGKTSGIYSSANEETNAKAGSVQVAASGMLSVSKGGQISSGTWSKGSAGSIKIEAGDMVVDGQGDTATVSSNANGTFSGDAGSVDVTVRRTLSVLNGGRISSSTYTNGHAGSVKIAAGNMLIDAQGSEAYTGVSSNAQSGTGDAGTVALSAAGELSIANGGVIESKTKTSGQAGLVKVQAGSLAIAGLGSGISSDADEGSRGNAGGIDVAVERALSIASGGYISSSTQGTGNAGSVGVQAGTLSIDGKGVYTGIYSGTTLGGRGGDIGVTVQGDIDMKAGGVIVGSTNGAGDAGSIRVNARTIAIDGSNSVEFYTGIESSSYAAEQGPSGNAGSIAIGADTVRLTRNGRLASSTQANGRGGTLTLDVRHLALAEGGHIDSETQGTGHAGDIAIRAAEDVVIEGVGDVHGWLPNGKEVTGQFSSIFLNTNGTGNGGNLQLTTPRLTLGDGGTISAIAGDGKMANLPETKAGSIRVNAGTITLTGGGEISASTSGAAMAGSVAIEATEGIALSGKFDRSRHPNVNNPRMSEQSSIDSKASYAADKDAKTLGIGGNVTITTPLLALADGGEIITSTEGPGRAGSIRINAGTLSVDGIGSRVDASAAAGSAGQTGSVTITATEAVRLADGGTLSVRNDATVGDPAALTPTLLTVTAPVVTLKNASITAAAKGNVSASDIRIDFTDRLFLDPSSITTSAVGGNGGAISISGGDGTIVLENSQITTSTRLGNGGPIAIGARSLVMNTGFIVANAENGPAGGTVDIDVRTLVPSGNTLFKGGQTLQDFRPGVFGYNVIQAAAPSGLGGTVQVTAPALDISGVLSGLSAQLLDTGGLGRSPCRIGGGSSLVQTGRGGFAPSARDLLGPESPAPARSAANASTGRRDPPLALAQGCPHR